MKTSEIVGFRFDDEPYCVECTEDIHVSSSSGIDKETQLDNARDGDGKSLQPIFSLDDSADKMGCMRCLFLLIYEE